jgi:hypothetical protein
MKVHVIVKLKVFEKGSLKLRRYAVESAGILEISSHFRTMLKNDMMVLWAAAKIRKHNFKLLNSHHQKVCPCLCLFVNA